MGANSSRKDAEDRTQLRRCSNPRCARLPSGLRVRERRAWTRKTEKMAREAIEEARMVLPGIQALFGFQLIAVFSQTPFHVSS